MSEFHFSPRPNRAHEIDWQPWSPAPFERAASEQKPVLLAISAVWCHWCHVMDETSYSDETVIETINRDFVPVRVDNDQRPDVNARYNRGGWPTTAFLTPSGAMIAGGTYVPPEAMRTALAEVAKHYSAERDRIDERASELLQLATSVPPAGELHSEAIASIVHAIGEMYDQEYGGFGTAPKFPMTDALELLLLEHRVTGEARLYEMLAATLLAMSSGGMYDHVEGGFFRYSTTRDWSVPHFEKMTEDHAGLLRALAGAWRLGGNDAIRPTLHSTTSYVRTVLFDPQTNYYAGSQDADEAYYALPLDERRKHAAPYVDRTVYANWNASLAGALLAAGEALDDEALVASACATLDALHERMLHPGSGLLHHFMVPGGAPQVHGLLTDQAAYLRALLDAHEIAGQARFLDRARALAEALETHLAAPHGGCYDRPRGDEELGNLAIADVPLAENAGVADSLLRLAVLSADATGGEPADTQLRARAERTLRVHAASAGGGGIFAAPYARALRRYVSGGASVTLAGTPRETAELRETARSLPDPLLCVLTRPPQAHEHAPLAYVCAAGTCAAPVARPEELAASYETLRAAVR